MYDIASSYNSILNLNTSISSDLQVSESGTSNSVASAEDVQKLAVILGISNVEDVYQEKFRVDRRRLEGMLAGMHYVN